MLAFQLIVKIALEVVVDLRKKKIAQQFNFRLVKKYFRARQE